MKYIVTWRHTPAGGKTKVWEPKSKRAYVKNGRNRRGRLLQHECDHSMKPCHDGLKFPVLACQSVAVPCLSVVSVEWVPCTAIVLVGPAA